MSLHVQGGNMKLFFSCAVLFSSVPSALSLLLDSARSVSHGSRDILTAVGASSMTASDCVHSYT